MNLYVAPPKLQPKIQAEYIAVMTICGGFSRGGVPYMLPPPTRTPGGGRYHICIYIYIPSNDIFTL